MIVVGVGNPYRGDDGAGWAVIDELSKTLDAKFLLKSRADLGDFLEIFSSHSIVYIVDACLSDAPIGSWRRIDALQEEIPPERPQTSTHGLSLSQIFALAKNLHQLPSQLTLYVIAGKEFQMKDCLSPPIQAAVQEVAQEIWQEICTKNTSLTI